MKIKDLITKDNWIKGAYSKNNRNEIVPLLDSDATKFCLYGWIRKVYGENMEKYSKICRKVIEYTDCGLIESWNDYSERKFKDVKKLVEKLNI